jgi:PST family polysaccharide transporter/lipopolysaccharide exporter
MLDRLKQFLARLSPEGSILEQTVKSGAWMGAMNVLSRGLQLVMIVVLANLLEPADFGLMGIALLVLSGLRNVSDMGLNAAVIQRTDSNVDEYLNTMWVIEIVRGLVIAGVLVALAPVIASVFDEPRATLVVRVVALSPLFMALRNPGIVYFKKRLNFHMEFIYQMGGSVTRFAVSLGWALVSPSVWALVAGLVLAEFTKTVISHLAHGYRPWPAFNLERARELIDYGKWVTGNSILNFLSTEGDDAVVGWLLSSAALGFYQTAYRLSNAPATEISQVVGGVMFPAFSSLQEDAAALRDAYYRTLQLTMFVACPAAFGIAAVADVFVRAFMGADWVPIIPLIQILSVYGLTRAIGQTMGPLWKAMGRPDYQTKLSGLRVILLALLVIPVTNAFGVEGTALLIVGVSVFPVLPVEVYLTVEILDGSYRRLLREMAYPLVAAGLMYATVVTVDGRAPLGDGVVEFGVLVATGVVVYAGLAGLMALQFDWDIQENIRSLAGAVG